MLIDLGNSDGLWLFENEIRHLKQPNDVFLDVTVETDLSISLVKEKGIGFNYSTELEIEKIRNLQRTFRLVNDYSMPNVSEKIARIILSYTDYVNRVIWKKY